MCALEPLGIEAFWSPTDVSLPGVITCKPVEINDWLALGLEVGKELVKQLVDAGDFFAAL